MLALRNNVKAAVNLEELAAGLNKRKLIEKVPPTTEGGGGDKRLGRARVRMGPGPRLGEKEKAPGTPSAKEQGVKGRETER